MTVSSGSMNGSSSCKPYSRKLLRILSLLFAIGLGLFCIGLGGGIYMDRAMNLLVSQSSVQLTGEHRQVLTDWFAGIVRQDASAVHFAEVDMEKLNAKYCYSPDGTYIVVESDTEKTYDYSLAEQPNYTGKTKASYNDDLAEFNSIAKGTYGMKWSLLRVSGVCGWFMWIGCILAVISLIFWLTKGGRWSNRSDTAVMPAVVACAAIGVVFILICFLVSADFSQSLRIIVKDAGIQLIR